MSYYVTAADLGNIRLNELKTVNSVLQNIALILATPKGSVPFYRDFGISNELLDKPMPVAKAMMVGEVREAIETWEPKARVASVRFEENGLEPGRLIPTVEVEIDVEQ